MVRTLTRTLAVFLLSNVALASEYPDPSRYVGSAYFQAIDEHDRKQAPPKGSVLVLGDIRIDRWFDAKDALKPLTTVVRGARRLTFNDIDAHFDYLIGRYEPRAVVIASGVADVAFGVPPEQVAQALRRVLERIQENDARTRVYVMSLEPIMSAHDWEQISKANALVMEVCAENEAATFINVTSHLLDDSGTPRDELLFAPMLAKWNPAAYEPWTTILRDKMVAIEREFEPK